MIAFLALPADWFSFPFIPPAVYDSLKIGLCFDLSISIPPEESVL